MMRRWVAGAVVLAIGLCVASTASAEPDAALVLYVAPVRAEVIDPFRPPAHIGAPGNRGLEYGTQDGDVVGASADGRVSFAGSVAGRGVVTIEHDDGVRTTYSGLAERFVVAGQRLTQFDAIGLAEVGFHFGARRRDHYLDPQVLIDASVAEQRAKLVPVIDE